MPVGPALLAVGGLNGGLHRGDVRAVGSWGCACASCRARRASLLGVRLGPDGLPASLELWWAMCGSRVQSPASGPRGGSVRLCCGQLGWAVAVRSKLGVRPLGAQ